MAPASSDFREREQASKRLDAIGLPAEEYRSILQEYQKAQQELMKTYREAKTDEEQRNALTKLQQSGPFAERLLQLAEKHSKDPVSVDALTWIVTRTGGGPEVNKLKDRAIEMILADHIQSDKLGNLCTGLVYTHSEASEKLLRAILDKSPHHDVQGMACLSLAEQMKIRSESMAAARKADAGELSREAEKLLEQVVDQYGNVKHGQTTLAGMAKPWLFELRYLAVGMTPPDIEGEDIDGKKFKLSDYRGKVVVLDFWGNW